MKADRPDTAGVDPEEFLRALLRISPEDAAKAREEAAKAGTTATPKPDDKP